MSIYKIFYETDYLSIDITFNVFQKCSGINKKGHFVATIPGDDGRRNTLFTDIAYGVRKRIEVFKDNKHWKTLNVNQSLEIPIFAHIPRTVNDAHELLSDIHKSITFKHGNINCEYSEQLMLCRFLPRTAKVLEFGTNLGRTALVIASILNDETQFVTMETSIDWANQARDNRDINGKKFHIVNAALSLQPLFQVDMQCSTNRTENCTQVSTYYTLDELRKQYPIDFDTLVVDCEGSFYNILKEFPSILDGIQLIIVENDYTKIETKNEIDSILLNKNFHSVYREMMTNIAYNPRPLGDCFYEVWQCFS
jgi:FkbM family methyltransferase